MRDMIAKRWGMIGRRACAVAAAGTLVLSMAGCAAGGTASSAGSSTEASSSAASGQQANVSVAYAAEIDESPYKLEYSSRDRDASYDESNAVLVSLKGSTAESSGSSVAIDGATVTIGAEGVYVLGGTLDNGQVVVDAPEDAKVQIVLKDASVTNSSGPALYVKQADKCFITLPEGSVNSLADGADYANANSDANAALYATSDLTLQGSGQLTVNGNCNDAIKTKDDLVVTGGSYTIKATGDGLAGHDSVKVSGGALTVDAGNDALKSSKDDDESKGFVSIDGGSLVLKAGDKGVNAVRYIRVCDGAKLDITSEGDAIHSDNFARIAGGELNVSSGDDAVHAEYVLAVDGGTVEIPRCKEGYEAQVITVNGSATHIVASDDGINASTGGTTSDPNAEQAPGGVEPGEGQRQPGWGPGQGQSDRGQLPQGQEGQAPQGAQGEGGTPPAQESGSAGEGQNANDGVSPEAPSGAMPGGQGNPDRGGRGMNGEARGQRGMGGDPMADSDANCIVTINAGTIAIEAEGDGVDSNGYIYVNGGETYVSGPTSSGNASLDYGLGAEVRGGTFIAAGSAGMAESFTSGTQAFALVNASGSAGDAITVSNSSGTVLAEYTATKGFQCVIVSVPGMSEGEYKLSVSGSETTFTASTTAAQGGMNPQMGGREGRGGMDGQMPGEQGGRRDAQGGQGEQAPGAGFGGEAGGPSSSATIA